MLEYFIACFLLVYGRPLFCHAQPANVITQPVAEQQAIATFEQALSQQKEIYNGPEHYGYAPTIEGLPYFLAKDWLPGTISYNGLLYQNEWLKYDVVKDLLVVKRFDGFAIQLRSSNVSYFSIPGYTFIYSNQNDPRGLPPGFYEQLATGQLTILAKHTKKIAEKIDEVKFHQRFTDETTYYAVTANKQTEVKNLQSVLGLVGLTQRAVQPLLKKAGIRFKKNKALALRTIAAYYNKN